MSDHKPVKHPAFAAPYGVSVLGVSTPIEKSPVERNTTAHHDKLSGAVAAVTAKESHAQAQ